MKTASEYRKSLISLIKICEYQDQLIKLTNKNVLEHNQKILELLRVS